MANEPPETIPPKNETPVPEILTPEIIDETEGGILPYEEDEPPLDDLPDDGNLPDYALIEESVAFINRTIAEMVKTVFLKIGDHLLARYFNDSVELASSKNRYKNRSYAELCRRPELSVTRQQLGVMIPLAAQERYFLLTNVDVNRLHYTHKLYLLQLPDGDEKYVLAQECIRENWPSRQLKARIRQIKQAAVPYENPNLKIVNQYKETMGRLISKSAMPELLSTQEGLYRLDREALLQLKEDAAQWVTAMEAKAEKYAALMAQVDYTLAHPNY